MDGPGWLFGTASPALSGATRPPRCLLPPVVPLEPLWPGPPCPAIHHRTPVLHRRRSQFSGPPPAAVYLGRCRYLDHFHRSLLFATQQHLVHLWTSEREGWVFCPGRPKAHCFRVHSLWFTGLVLPSLRRLRLSLSLLWTTRHETPPPACLLPSQAAGHCPTPSMTLAHTGAASDIPPASRIRGESSQWVWEGGKRKGGVWDCVTVPARAWAPGLISAPIGDHEVVNGFEANTNMLSRPPGPSSSAAPVSSRPSRP